LLSAASSLSASVKGEVARMHPARAYVIGDTTSLSDQVRSDVATAAGIPLASVVRISNGSDSANAVDIANRMDYRTQTEKDTDVPAFDAAVIANPASPHSAAVAGLAAARRLPILWVTADSIPAATASALDTLDIDKALVIGGPAQVSESVRTQVATAIGGTATRLGGADVYATSQAVVNESKARGLPSNVVFAADGAKPIDGAVLGAAVARITGIMVLAPAPLYNTAAGQASNFGLTGISRTFLVGPPKPGTTPVPLPKATIYPQPKPSAKDTTAPVCKLSGKKKQKVGKRVKVTVACTSEKAKAKVGATVKAAKKSFKLKSKTVDVPKGGKKSVGLKLSAKVRKALKRALKRHKTAKAKFKVKVSDSAGNNRTLTRTVKFKR